MSQALKESVYQWVFVHYTHFLEVRRAQMLIKKVGSGVR